MNKIIEEIHDPEWWFSIVGVALIVGVFSAYIKEWLGLCFGHFSRTFKEYNDRKIEEERLTVNQLSGNSTLLVLSYIRLVFMGLFFLLSVGFYLFTPILGLIAYHHPEMYVLHGFYEFSPEFKFAIARWSVIPYGIIMVYIEIRLMNRFRVLEKARNQLEKKLKYE